MIAGARYRPKHAKYRPVIQEPDCAVSLVLLAADKGDGVLTAIDNVSGGRGFSHCYWDTCEYDSQGRHLVIDCEPAEGVRYVPKETHVKGGRREVRIIFEGEDAAEAYGCARGKVGLPYDLMALVLPHGDQRKGVTCSSFIYQCLPRRFRMQLDAIRDGRLISPNLIAESFGIEGPDADDIIVPGLTKALTG